MLILVFISKILDNKQEWERDRKKKRREGEWGREKWRWCEGDGGRVGGKKEVRGGDKANLPLGMAVFLYVCPSVLL